MSFVKRLTSLFTPSALSVGRSVTTITVQCDRCGERISGPVDLRNDLSVEYDEATGATSFVCRKVLMGRQRCFQQVEVTLHFDAGRKLVDKQVSGGKFVEKAH
jgi:uncharacterized metal-binding protein YceD (DUF177 family)